jgi:hypothetical protein
MGEGPGMGAGGRIQKPALRYDIFFYKQRPLSPLQPLSLLSPFYFLEA